jgi:MoxR-like ATPase
VTVGQTTYDLPAPFFTIATQNPIEQEGTYPLPEAQLDRFMFHVHVDYPSEAEELLIVKRTTAELDVRLTPMLSGEQIIQLTNIVRKVPVADHVAQYAIQFARQTRRGRPGTPDFVNDYVLWGAGPRASQYMVLGAKARAVLQGRHYAGQDDIRAVAAPVLRHRIKTNFNADAEGITPDDLVRRLAETIPPVKEDDKAAAKVPEVFKTSS